VTKSQEYSCNRTIYTSMEFEIIQGHASVAVPFRMGCFTGEEAKKPVKHPMRTINN